MKHKFYGHGTIAILANISLAVCTPFHIFGLTNAIRIGAPDWLIYGYGWFVLMLLPNSTYLFLEIKHIIVVKDGIATGRPLGAVMAFGAMSIVGLALQVTAIIMLVNAIPLLSDNPFFSILILSVLCAFGGVFGLLNHTSMSGLLLPPILIYLFYKVVTDWKLSLLTIGVATLLSVLTVTVYTLL